MTDGRKAPHHNTLRLTLSKRRIIMIIEQNKNNFIVAKQISILQRKKTYKITIRLHRNYKKKSIYLFKYFHKIKDDPH